MSVFSAAVAHSVWGGRAAGSNPARPTSLEFMANVSQVKKIKHVVTVAEVSGSIAIPVLWDSPFNDTNYVISWSVEIVKAANPAVSQAGYFPQAIENVTRNGFTAVVDPFDPAVAGDTIAIHAMASHK